MAENIVVNDVTYNGVAAVAMETASGGTVLYYPDAVRYNPQELTEAQKTQARENIGAASVEAEIPYIVGNSAEAGVWTGTCDKITEYREGLTILYKTNVAGVSGGSTLNINNLGAVAVCRNASTAVTTIYPAGTVLMLTYSSDKWLTADYDANSKNTAGTSNKAATKLYLIGGASQSSSGVTTYSNSSVYIGTDNCLYSNGKKVAVADDIPTVDSIIAALPKYAGEVS